MYRLADVRFSDARLGMPGLGMTSGKSAMALVDTTALGRVETLETANTKRSVMRYVVNGVIVKIFEYL